MSGLLEGTDFWGPGTETGGLEIKAASSGNRRVLLNRLEPEGLEEYSPGLSASDAPGTRSHQFLP